MMTHRYPRTERDLRKLAVWFSAGKITRALPECLECLAAWHRLAIETDKARDGLPHNRDAMAQAYDACIERLRAAGVDEPDGELTGPDRTGSAT